MILTTRIHISNHRSFIFHPLISGDNDQLDLFLILFDLVDSSRMRDQIVCVERRWKNGTPTDIVNRINGLLLWKNQLSRFGAERARTDQIDV